MPAAHPGGRVLLVEDNLINQRVASAMLHRLGLAVTLATDGAEAVERVREIAYDLVLMDCQMPGMDGFEATRRIRDWEARSGAGRSLPIVALTANARAGDRAACLEAGMTDYLAKPITGPRLAEMIERHLGVGAVAPPATPAAAEIAQRAQPAVFDASVLAALPMVADGSEPEFAAQVLAQYRLGSAESIAQCQRALQAGDDRTALRCVHTLKSSSAQVGALALAASAGVMEDGMRAGHPVGDLDLAALQSAHGQALEAIAAHLGEPRGAAMAAGGST
jgi:CheY-like chemotaxis protein